MSITNVESVCTDQHLADEVLGIDHLQPMRPHDWESFAPVRQAALDEVLIRLRGRTPPVRETDLQDVTELRAAVVYGALAKVYRANMNSADKGDKHAAHARSYQQMYEREVQSLQPTVAGAARPGPASIAFHRR